MIDIQILSTTALQFALRFLLLSTVLFGTGLLVFHFFPRIPHRLRDYTLKAALIASIAGAILFALPVDRPSVARFQMPLQLDVQTSLPVQPGEASALDPDAGTAFTSPETPVAERPAVSGLNWPALLSLTWLCVIIAGFSLYAFRWFRLVRRIKLRRPALNDRLLRITTRLSDAAGLHWPIHISLSEDVSCPFAIGNREICLPASALETADDEELESMIAHELAHLVRRDPLWLMIWHLAGILFFFQPLVHIARRSYQASAEYLCDAWTIRHTQRPEALVRCMVTAAEGFQHNEEHRLAAGMASSRGVLLDRARRALQGHKESNAIISALIAAISVIIMAFAAPVIEFDNNQDKSRQRSERAPRPEKAPRSERSRDNRVGAISPAAKSRAETPQTPSTPADKPRATGANTYYSISAGKDAFLVKHRNLLNTIFAAGTDTFPNPLPGTESDGIWDGSLSERQDGFHYRITFESVELTKAGDQFHRMGADGFMRIKLFLEEDVFIEGGSGDQVLVFKAGRGDEEHLVELKPEDGVITRSYYLNGRLTPLDAAAEERIHQVIDLMLRLQFDGRQ